MALIIDIEGKYTKEDWINNFTIVAELLSSLAAKIDNDKLASNNGIATLNNVGKVIQTALNADKLNGLTLAQILGLDCIVLENDIDLFEISTASDYFIQDCGDTRNLPSGIEPGTEAFITCRTYGDSAMLEFKHVSGTWRSFKSAVDTTYSAWIAN